MNTCLVVNCSTDKRLRVGYCGKHYKAFRLYGNPLTNKKFKKICSVEECDNFVKSHSMCSKHLSRFQRHGNINYTLPDSQTRYHASYKRGFDEECWPWIKGRTQDGYGKFTARVNGIKKTFVASRFGWELLYGVIPEGYFVCHICDTPACQNPSHWFLGTPLDNTRDMIAKGRGVYTGRERKDPINGRFI